MFVGDFVIRQKNGMIIIFVVVIVGIISILYASIYVLIGIENRIEYSLESRTKAYYLAEGGIERAMAELRAKDIKITTTIAITSPFPTEYKAVHGINVTINPTSENTFTLTSTGTYGITKRDIQVTLSKNGTDLTVDTWKEID